MWHWRNRIEIGVLAHCLHLILHITCILISLIIGGTSITLALGNLDNKQCINIFSTLSPITSQADGIYITQGEKRYDKQ